MEERQGVYHCVRSHFNLPSAAPALPPFSLSQISQPYASQRPAGLYVLLLQERLCCCCWVKYTHAPKSYFHFTLLKCSKPVTGCTPTSRHFIFWSYSLAPELCANPLQLKHKTSYEFRSSLFI